MRKAKGITLIALVVTIIVLIILAGVTLNLVFSENGIIQKSKTAKLKQTEAEILEALELAKSQVIFEGEGYTELDKYLNYIDQKELNGYKVTSVEKKDEANGVIWVEGEYKYTAAQIGKDVIINSEGTTIALDKSSITLKIENDGTNITKDTEILTAIILPSNTINKSVTWKSSNEGVAIVTNGVVTPVASGTATITATTNDGSNKSASCSVIVNSSTIGKSILNTGDYVQYEPTPQTYTMTTAQTGYSSNQTFNTANATNLWQVLYNNDTYGIQITSSASVASLGLGTAKNTTSAKNGYNNSINTLNAMCAKYVNEQYAVSGRSIGSNPANPSAQSTSVQSVSSIWSGSNLGLYQADSNYTSDVTAMASATSQNSAGITTIGTDYFLASRHVTKSSDGDHYSFRVNYINNSTGKALSGDSGNRIMACSDGAGFDPTWAARVTKGVRPVVKLADGIKVTSGDGTRDNPYILKPIS